MARFLAIDGDHPQMQIAAATVNRGSIRIEKALTWAESQTVNVATAAELGKRLRERLKDAGIAPAPVLVCLGRERIVVKEVKYPPVAEAEEPALVRFQATKELTESAEDVVIDYFPLPSTDAERRAAVVIVRKEIVRAFQALCAAAGLKLQAITPRPVATVAALQRAIASGAVAPIESLSSSVALLTRGERWGELTIARGGEAVFARTLSGPALTTETGLLGEVRRNLAVYAGQVPGSPVQALYVAESESPAVGWSGRLRSGLTIPVHAFDPIAGVAADSPPEHRGAFAGLAGLFALMSRAASLPVNFVAPRQPKPQRDPNKRLIALVGPVLALVLLVGVGVGVMAKADNEQKITQLQERKVAMDESLKKLEEDAKRIKALDDWTKRGVVWLDEIYDLTSRFPEITGTRLASMTVTAREPDKNVKSYYPAHMELKLETEDGKSIDRMLSEMVRDVHYKVGPKEPKGAAGFGNTRFNQAFLVRADVVARKPTEYTRKLNVSPPPKRTGRVKDEIKEIVPDPMEVNASEGRP